MLVEHPAMTAFLLDPEARRVLLPFYGRGASVTEAAQWLGQPPNRVLKRVYTLEKHGLLKVVDITRRGGRPIKRYGVTHRDFFVSFRCTAATTVEDLLMQAVDEPGRLVASALPRLVAQIGQLGYIVGLQDDGRLAHNLSIDGQRPLDPQMLPRPWRRGAAILHLTDAQARAFLNEQEALLDRYTALSAGHPREPPARGTDPYLAYFAFSPILGALCPTAPTETDTAPTEDGVAG